MANAECRIVLMFMLLVLAAGGCAHYPTQAELAEVYRVGLPRSEAAEAFGEPHRVAERPAAGWEDQKGGSEQTGASARAFEEKHAVSVQTCHVYWIPRGIMGLGIFWDYLYFGSDDRLLGFNRRFVD